VFASIERDFNEAVLGAAVPPAIDAIASGVADSLGGAGYVVVGPLPASASADGPRRNPNMFPPGVLRQPLESNAAAAHVVNNKLVLFAFVFSILPTFDTVFRVNESFRYSEYSRCKSIKSAKSA
jgi:hypothetical protein